MAQVFIIGGAGKVGQRLSPLLAAAGHKVSAMIRNSDQASMLRGAVPVMGDLLALDAQGLAGLMAGHDVVVFSAGAGGKGGPELTQAIDGDGLKTAVAAAEAAGIKRFLLVSAFPDAGRGAENPNPRFELYMQVKRAADAHLARTALDWVILRPGTLTDSAGTGQIRAGLAIPYGNVSRDDVAATLAALVDRPALRRIIIELTEGETPITDALDALMN